jgi:hypothetical protein
LTSSGRIVHYLVLASGLVSDDGGSYEFVAAMCAANEYGYSEESVGGCCWVGEHSEDQLMRGMPWKMVCRASLLLLR